MKTITVNTPCGVLRVTPTKENKAALNTLAVMMIFAIDIIEKPEEQINIDAAEITVDQMRKVKRNIHKALDSVGYYKGY